MPVRSEVMFVGCYTADRGDGRGIVALRVDADGTLTPQGEPTPVVSPSFLAWHPTLPVLYAVSETEESEVTAWTVSAEGGLARHGHAETGGADACHVAVDPDGRFLLVTNYSGGSLAVHRLGEDGGILALSDLVPHKRHSISQRQTSPHPHMAKFTPDGVLVVDLGGDVIYRYRVDADGRAIQSAAPVELPPGTGPRHLTRAGECWYVAGELDASVACFDEQWRLLGKVPSTRSAEPAFPSEIAASGDFVYVANRGPDTVAVFNVEGGLPDYVAEVPTGEWPRHLAIVGDRLYVASERSHELAMMTVDPATGIPKAHQVLAVPSPTCVLPPKP
ncbi:MAG TPA: lactonase family protein [Candidatus Limnocylindrales bacterium]